MTHTRTHAHTHPSHIRLPLRRHTGELQRRNGSEEALRAGMAAAVAAAQEEAHRKVEDGFREASHAVSKAL